MAVDVVCLCIYLDAPARIAILFSSLCCASLHDSRDGLSCLYSSHTNSSKRANASVLACFLAISYVLDMPRSSLESLQVQASSIRLRLNGAIQAARLDHVHINELMQNASHILIVMVVTAVLINIIAFSITR